MQNLIIRRIIGIYMLVMLTVIINGTHAYAHNPHDPVYAMGVSPNFANDRTLFVSTDGEITGWRYPEVLRSTDGGTTWTLLPWGMDNRSSIFAIRVSPGYNVDRTVFVATGNGVYKSSTRGDFWEPFNTGLIASKYATKLEIGGLQNNYTLFLAIENDGVYRRTHLQTEWTKVLDRSAGVNIIATSSNFAQDKTVVVANSNGTIKISTDGGISWVDKGNPTGAIIYDIAIAPGSAREIFLATDDGIFVSNNWGNSFTAKLSNLPAEAVNNIVFSPNYQTDRTVFCTTFTKAIYKSTNNGNSWVFHDSTAHITGQTVAAKEFSELQVSKTFATDQALFLSTFDGVFIATNGGNVWSQKQTRENLITGLALSPNFVNDQTIMATTYFGGGFYTSTDKGATWLAKAAGWPNQAVLSPFDIDFVKNHTGPPLAIATDNKSFLGFSDDFGENWDTLPIPLLPDIGEGDIYPTVIALSPIFDTDQEIYIGTRTHGVLQTLDGGINWHRAVDVPHVEKITSIVTSPNYANDKTVFAANKSGEVWRTQNGGGSWTRIGIDSIVTQGKLSYMWIAISPQFATDHLLLIGTNNGIYRSANGGNSWKPFLHKHVGPATVIQQIEFSPTFAQDRTVYATVRGKGLYRLILGTTGWIMSAQNLGTSLLKKNIQFTEFHLSPNFSEDATILGASRRNIYISTDGGLNWIPIGSPGS